MQEYLCSSTRHEQFVSVLLNKFSCYMQNFSTPFQRDNKQIQVRDKYCSYFENVLKSKMNN